MKFWYDTEFIENGETIDLISIGIVAEDGRAYYAQNAEAKFKQASDWVARNVYPYLAHFHMLGERDCQPSRSGDRYTGAACFKDNCPWRDRWQIRDEIKTFCDPEKYGKPELWGYYSAYDHVVLCQLFGTMMELPKGWPMYTRDIKQLCDHLGNPKLPEQGKGEHHALADARWNQTAWAFLQAIRQP